MRSPFVKRSANCSDTDCGSVVLREGSLFERPCGFLTVPLHRCCSGQFLSCESESPSFPSKPRSGIGHKQPSHQEQHRARNRSPLAGRGNSNRKWPSHAQQRFVVHDQTPRIHDHDLGVETLLRNEASNSTMPPQAEHNTLAAEDRWRN